MKWIHILFGHGSELDTLQMTVRGIVIFALTLVMIRLAGQRTFGKRSPVDNVVIIMLGAVLSRAVVGASPFIPTVVASFAIVLIHRLLGHAALLALTILAAIFGVVGDPRARGRVGDEGDVRDGAAAGGSATA